MLCVKLLIVKLLTQCYLQKPAVTTKEKGNEGTRASERF